MTPNAVAEGVGVEEVELERPKDDMHDQPIPISKLCTDTLRILIPTDVSSLLWMSSQTITMINVGQKLGEEGTAQYSAGIVIFNMCGFSFIQGFGAAIDTLSSQAFGRNSKAPEVGEILQMAMVLNLLLGTIFSILFMNAEPVVCLAFAPSVCSGAARFLRYSPPYMYAQIISGVMSKSMYAQKLPEVVAVANLVAALASPVANYFFTPMGIHGAAIALSVSVGLCAVTHVMFALWHPKVILKYAPWPSPKLWNATSWSLFFKIGIPSLVATCAEWWAFEVQTVLAGCISDTALAIHGMVMNVVNFLFSVALGVCVAASVVVGNSLGSGRPRQAKQFAHFILVCDVLLGLLTAVTMLVLGRYIASLFTSKKDLIQGLTAMMPFAVLCHVGDSLQFCLQGIFRGAGKPAHAGAAVLATLWCVGVPMSLFFVFVLKTGVAGCIGGMIVGMALEIPVLLWWMRNFDWNQLACEAQQRHENESTTGGVTVVVENWDNDDHVSSQTTQDGKRRLSEASENGAAGIASDSDNSASQELSRRLPHVLEELCCSLHESFAISSRT